MLEINSEMLINTTIQVHSKVLISWMKITIIIEDKPNKEKNQLYQLPKLLL